MASIGMDGRGFRAGLLGAEKAAMQFARRIGGYFAAYFSVAAIGRFAKYTIDWASKMNDLAKSIGVSASQMQELDYAAKQTGASAEAVVAAFKAMSKWRTEALSDSKGKAGSLASALGFGKGELLAIKEPMRLFERLATVLQSRDFGAGQGDVITSIFGRGGLELLPMIREGFSGLRDKAHEAGVVLKDEVVEGLDRIGDKIAEITGQLRNEFGPAIVWITESIVEMVDKSVFGLKVLANALKVADFKRIWENASMAGALGAGAAPNTKNPLVTVPWVFKFWKSAINSMPLENIGQALETAVFKTLTEDIFSGLGKNKQPGPPELIQSLLPREWTTKAGKGDFKVPTDTLAKIGGFIGGAGRPMQIAQEQLTELRTIKQEVRKIAGFATSSF